MITILKGTSVTIRWRIIRTINKITEDFSGAELRVFLVGPDNTYVLSPNIESVDGYNEICLSVNSEALKTGVYDLKAVWVKNKHSIPDVVNNQFMSVSRRGGVLAVTYDSSEVTKLVGAIKLMSYVESYGRDGMSAYEAASFRGVLPEGMSEVEWVNQENVRLQNEAKRESNEIRREGAEAGRDEAYKVAEADRDARYVAAEGDSLSAKNGKEDRWSKYIASEDGRDMRYALAEGETSDSSIHNTRWGRYNRAENERDNAYATKEAERQTAYDVAETTRENNYKDNEGTRDSRSADSRWGSYNIAEENRGAYATTAENLRQDTFRVNEGERESLGTRSRWGAYNTAEAARESLFEKSQDARQSAFDLIENERRVAETARADAEVERSKAESSRVKAEQERVSAESGRKSAESSRVSVEALRVSAESSRVSAESARKSAESGRVSAENARVSAEAARKSAEAARKSAEQAREDAEQAREEAEAKREERTDEAIASIANKVDRTDNAPELTSGFAGNLVGRGEATSEEIGFRPSGGLTSVNDGAARIERLKGNTLVWNQCIEITVVTAMYDTTLYTFNLSNGLITVTKSEGGTTSSDSIFCYFRHQFIASRKYLLVYNLKRNDGQNSSHRIGGFGIYDGTKYHSIPDVAGDYKFFSPTESFTSERIQIVQLATAGVALSYTLRPVIYDLTQMFGAGNEPTTIEEFNARKPLGIDEYAYNEGELISTTADEIKSVGFNAIDSLFPDKAVAIKTGDIYNNLGTFATDYIKVLPNTQYYISQGKGAGWGVWLNSEKEVISSTGAVNDVVLSPSNASYLRITMASADGCIHLVHTGYRNGEYEPYEEFRRSLPISEIKDSEGNALFPNGLLSAGSAHDEITATKAIKRIGMVDMGSLEWQYESSTVRFKSDFSQFKVVPGAAAPNAVSSSYQAYTGIEFDSSKTLSNIFRLDNVVPRIYVRNLSYTDPATFKSAMSGVMLYYELAEPIEVDLPEPLNLDYEVSDFGTEEVLSDTPTTPLKADIIYQFNAVDRIRENSLSLEDLIKRVAALEAQNAALVQQLNATGNGETE